ncbi:MAG: DUF2807 domain-containing protein [Bacteroidales bacterium]|nr:DUF2807 domain-containing protein [Bacteroidales bacterium]
MNKINIAKILALSFFALNFTACISGENNDNQRELKDLSGFTRISFSISGNLILTQSDSFLVETEGSPASLDALIILVEGQTLVIKTKPGWKNLGDVTVNVKMPVVEGLSVAGSGNIHAEGPITSQKIDFSITGSGNIEFKKLMAEATNASIAGSGNIIISGESKTSFDASITGSGNINCENFESSDVNVNITGSGKAKVFAMENLSTNIVGSGDVYYRGRPLVKANSTGSGKTKAI